MPKLTFKEINVSKLNALLIAAWEEDWAISIAPMPDDEDRVFVEVTGPSGVEGRATGDIIYLLKWVRKAMTKALQSRKLIEHDARNAVGHDRE